MLARARILSLSFALVLVLGACGGGGATTAVEYNEAIAGFDNDLKDVLRQITNSRTQGDPMQLSQAMEALMRAVGRVDAKLADVKIKNPDLQAVHEEFKGAVGEHGGALKDLFARVKATPIPESKTIIEEAEQGYKDAEATWREGLSGF